MVTSSRNKKKFFDCSCEIHPSKASTLYLQYWNSYFYPSEIRFSSYHGCLLKREVFLFCISWPHFLVFTYYKVFAHVFSCFPTASQGWVLRDQRTNSWTAPCYSQSPLLTDFTLSPLSKIGLKLVFNVKIVKTSILTTLKIMPRNFNKIVRPWIRLPFPFFISYCSCFLQRPYSVTFSRTSSQGFSIPERAG